VKSIRARLIVALILLVALVSALAATVTYRRVLQETSILFDYQLRQMALSLRNQVSLAPRIEVPADQGDADFVVQIWDPFGARMYLSRPGLPMINQTVLGFADLSVKGEAWRAYGLQTANGVIQIAQPVRVRETLARGAAERVIVPLLLLLPLMLMAVAWTVGRGLHPLQRLASDVQRRDARSLKPVVSENLPTEIRPLADELNRLLVRLQAAFAVQRTFIADAAHELRSPLTALRLQLQLLDRAPDEAARLEARARLGEAIARAVHLAEQLLALARSDPQEAVGQVEAMDLSAVAAQGVADCHALALTRQVELSLESSPVWIAGEEESIRILIRNLIDNAVRYTPSGGRVQVRCAETSGGALLEVRDTGPGIPAADRERVFDRFYRPAQGRESGSGLGLAIVKAIAERHRALVDLADAPGGGLQVSVRFPRSP
jgi:two-component system OmpR family sensor kinase/two-component system sensor histidine kinase QseC